MANSTNELWISWREIAELMCVGETNARRIFKDIEVYIQDNNYTLNANKRLINRKLALQYLSQTYGI